MDWIDRHTAGTKTDLSRIIGLPVELIPIHSCELRLLVYSRFTSYDPHLLHGLLRYLLWAHLNSLWFPGPPPITLVTSEPRVPACILFILVILDSLGITGQT